jgi:hypothetical protein
MASLVALSIVLVYSLSPKVFLIDDDLKTERITNLSTIVTPTSLILKQITYQVKVFNNVIVSIQQRFQIFLSLHEKHNI